MDTQGVPNKPEIEFEIITGPDGHPYLRVAILSPEAEARMTRDAAIRGMTLEEYMQGNMDRLAKRYIKKNRKRLLREQMQ